MIFDVDESIKLLDQVLPWDFQVRIAGLLYDTARPTVAQVAQLSRLGKLGTEEGAALLQSLFAGRLPPEQELTIERVTTYLQAYMAYLSQRLSKNSPAVADQVRAATAGKTTT